jgi:Protein of unknown function (DUF2799)
MRYLPLLLVAACSAAMTESECRGTDWYERGRSDAMVYVIQPAVERYAQQCAAYGVQPSVAEYMEGWRIGYGMWNTGGRM